MNKTVKGLTYAIASGGDGTPMAYTGGKQKEKLTANASYDVQYAEGQDYGDGVRIARVRKVTGVNASLELTDLPADMRKDVLGWVKSTNDIVLQDVKAPTIGIGWYEYAETVENVDYFRPYWIYKIQFTQDNHSVATATDQINFQHETISGAGMGVKQSAEATNFDFIASAEEDFSSEAQCIAWLKSKAGIN